MAQPINRARSWCTAEKRQVVAAISRVSSASHVFIELPDREPLEYQEAIQRPYSFSYSLFRALFRIVFKQATEQNPLLRLGLKRPKQASGIPIAILISQAGTDQGSCGIPLLMNTYDCIREATRG